MGTAVSTVNRATGEVVAHVEAFDATAYIAGLTGNIKQEQALAAAYDAACASLIGPNDVQQDGGREFKKKSAWAKLARHFRLSTEVVGKSHGLVGDVFMAEVTVRASAPWGQFAEALGACATDEATGRRVITLSDALATAETRATNRAISRLIAMGEVSAEEVGDRSAARRPSGGGSRSSSGGASRTTMPFGKHKGKPLSEVPLADLSSTVAWAKDKDAEKFADLIAACEAAVIARSPSAPSSAGREDDDYEFGGRDDESELPF